MAAFLVAILIRFPWERHGSTSFRTGKLTGYNYTGPNGNVSAGVLQVTIWWLEGEGADPDNLFSMAVTNQFGAPWRPWRTTTALTVWAFSICGATAIILRWLKTS